MRNLLSTPIFFGAIFPAVRAFRDSGVAQASPIVFGVHRGRCINLKLRLGYFELGRAAGAHRTLVFDFWEITTESVRFTVRVKVFRWRLKEWNSALTSTIEVIVWLTQRHSVRWFDVGVCRSCRLSFVWNLQQKEKKEFFFILLLLPLSELL